MRLQKPCSRQKGDSVAKTTFLSFEQPIAELDAKIEDLRNVQDDSAVDISDEIAKLAQKSPAA